MKNENYSYLRAVIGSSLDALYAGYHPKKIPVREQTASEIIIEPDVISTGQLRK